MTVPGEVTFKVKQFIAARERFTTGQVAKLTGLNRKSVETVVQRLVRDGYVVKSRETAPGTGRGRRPLYYTLTTDIEKRRELVNEVSAFQPRAVPVRTRPLSANYLGAYDMLNDLEQEPDAPDREARLAKIEKHLELAAFEEGLEDGEEGTAVVRAYLLRERARVAALRRQWVEAGRLLGEAHRVFEEHGLEEEVEKADQYRFALLIRQRLAAAKDDEYEIARIWQEIPRIVQEMGLAANPVVQLMLEMSNIQSYIGMEYTEEDTLADFLEREGPLPILQAIDLTTSICYGLAAVHKRGILHRDIKPSNILLIRSGDKIVPRLSHLSLSSASKSDFYVGTLQYAAPEQLYEEPVGAQSDIYALGAVLYEMLIGSPPFAGSVEGILRAQLEQEPPSPRSARREILSSLEEVVLKALSKKPENRYETSEEMAKDLELVRQELEKKLKLPGALEKFREESKRHLAESTGGE
jgi:tRNA A-37 threonylcarbamoyl transferase component Bud32/DNA-binding MarR family transcriptional regulator